MKILLSLIFFTSCLSSFGQRIRFSDTTNRWTMFVTSCCGGPTGSTPYYNYRLHRSADTFYSGIMYFQNSDCYPDLLREDTIAKKVFIKQSSSRSHFDTVERILYDYNLRLNDTIKFTSDFDGFLKRYVSYVSNFDSTKINGQWYKVWEYTCNVDSPTSIDVSRYNVIEGIGCTNGPSYPAFPYPLFEYSEQLTCFQNNGNQYSLSNPVFSWGWSYYIPFDDSLSCLLPLNINAPASKKEPVQVVPNPINEFSKITLPYTIHTGSLVILNCVGKEIYHAPFQDKNELPIGDHIPLPGIYFYQVRDNESGKFLSGKFLAQ
jgi:hypothetical protein